MKKLIIVSLMLSQYCFAQYAKTIATARPGQSVGANVVGQNALQLQSGYLYEDIGAGLSTLENVLRYGAGETFEVAAVMNYSQLKIDEDTLSGLSSLQFGARKNIFKNSSGFVRSVGLQLRNAFALDNDFDDEKDNQIFLVAASVLDNFTTNYVTNIEEWSDIVSQRFTLAFSDNINDKYSYLAEIYVDWNDDETFTSLDYGIGYLVNEDILLDLSVGHDIDDREYSFLSFGFSTRTR